jgi:Spy/CpxP family protein refolding chaperone
LIIALALLGRVEAQPSQQHHRGGAQTSQAQTGEETQEAPAQAPMGQPMQGMMQQMEGMMQQMQGMMQQMHSQMGRGMMRGYGMMRDQEDDDPSDDRGMRGRGMMRGHGGVMGHMQRKLDRLTQQLDLTDEQQSKVQALLRTHAKDGIRLKADFDTASIDLQQLLDAQPVDMAKVKTALQTIAAKEADLRLTHISAMQGIRELLTPDQQKQFRAVWRHMLGGGMMGRGGIQKHGKQMGREGMKGQGAMKNPCGMQHGKSDN